MAVVSDLQKHCGSQGRIGVDPREGTGPTGSLFSSCAVKKGREIGQWLERRYKNKTEAYFIFFFVSLFCLMEEMIKRLYADGK